MFGLKKSAILTKIFCRESNRKVQFSLSLSIIWYNKQYENRIRNLWGRPLKTLEGKTTRPTSDKVRGAIFNMIGPYFEVGRVLDLYAGSGGLSIEAVSRGMSSAVLVERDRKAQTIVAENIQMTKEVGKFQLLKMDAERALEQVSGEFDLVFLDPPYAKEQIVADIEKMAERELF